jgi:hypothetical protein
MLGMWTKTLKDLTKVEDNGLAYIFLSLASEEVRDDVGGVVAEELAWSHQIFTFRLVMLALQLLNYDELT